MSKYANYIIQTEPCNHGNLSVYFPGLILEFFKTNFIFFRTNVMPVYMVYTYKNQKQEL